MMKKTYEAPELNKISFLPDQSIMDEVLPLPTKDVGTGSDGSGDLPFNIDLTL